MPRQAFGDFLNSPGPSTPRGRGGFRGGGRGRGGAGGDSPSGFRGGRGGGHILGGAGGQGRSFKTDYSNVGFDYTAVNRQQYTKMDGFNVAPYGNIDSPGTPHGYGRGRGRGRGGGSTNSPGGSYTPRGRGRGGGLGFTPDRLHTPQSVSAQDSPGPSGSATPVTGLGYHKDKGKGRAVIPGAAESSTPVSGRMASTVGRGIGTGDIMWGGRKGAPMFVKAGELFKDGEVDLVTKDEDKAVEVEDLPPSHSPARKTSTTTSNIEAEVQGSPSADAAQASPARDLSPGSSTQPQVEEVVMEDSSIEADPVPLIPSTADVVGPKPQDSLPADVSETPATQSAFVDQAESQDPTEMDTSIADDDFPELILDTAPQPVFEPSSTVYTSHLFAPLGSGKPQSDDEEIVFKPRQFAQPQPIQLDSSSLPAVRASADDIEPIQAFIDPRARKVPAARKDKKMAKKEKRKQRGAAGKRAKLRDDIGAEDDIDWGSDGPSAGLKGIEGIEEDLPERDVDGDVAILRDYLEGTKLSKEEDSEDEENAAITAAMDEMAGIGPARFKGKSKASGKGKGKVTAAHADTKDEGQLEKGRSRKTRSAPGWIDHPVIVAAATSIEDDDEDDWEDEDGDGGSLQPSAAGVDDPADGDSDASSDLGDLQAIVDAMDSDDDEDDEEGEEALFNGKSAWTSEDEGDWFVRNMEEALGLVGSSSAARPKPSKAKKVLFSSIENGDFDMELPTEPVKKGKKKVQGIPEALQEQWETDRQKKAFKKEQRQLERLIAEIEGAKSSRRKGKGTSKAQQASLAHLIPASASQVADMFDIDSEDEDDFGGGGRGMNKMRKMLNLPPVSNGPVGSRGGMNDMESIVNRIREFIDDAGRTTFALHPMEKEGRERVHLLSECFGLKSNSKGKGKARFTILIKTSRTGQFVNEERISRLVSASSFTGGQFYKALYSRGAGAGGGGGGGPGKGGKKGPGDRGSSTRAKEGDLVGEGAERIGETNMGHKLLSKMGWAEGGKIGRTDGGLDNPIVAVVKYTKSGLGA